MANLFFFGGGGEAHGLIKVALDGFFYYLLNLRYFSMIVIVSVLFRRKIYLAKWANHRTIHIFV